MLITYDPPELYGIEKKNLYFLIFLLSAVFGTLLGIKPWTICVALAKINATQDVWAELHCDFR